MKDYIEERVLELAHYTSAPTRRSGRRRKNFGFQNLRYTRTLRNDFELNPASLVAEVKTVLRITRPNGICVAVWQLEKISAYAA